jgi:hypothetical protein
MTTTQACGTGFGLGLVAAATAAVVFRSKFFDALSRWFWYRKEAPAYRYPFPRIGRR